jgi:hypothetical protein
MVRSGTSHAGIADFTLDCSYAYRSIHDGTISTTDLTDRHPLNRVRLAGYWKTCEANSLEVLQAATIHFSLMSLGCQSLCFTLVSFSPAQM